MGILADFFTLLNNVRNYRTQNTTDQDVTDFFNTYVNPTVNSDEEPETINTGQFVFVEEQDGGTLYVGGAAAKKKIIAIDELVNAADLDDNEVILKTTIDGLPVFVGKPLNEVTQGFEFSAKLSQVGTSPPVIEYALVNKTGQDVEDLSYVGVGHFSINFAGDIISILNGPDLLNFRNSDIVFSGAVVGKIILDEVNTTASRVFFYTLNPAGVPTNGLLSDGTNNTDIYFKTYS